MDLQSGSPSEMQPVSLSEMQAVEGGQHHKNDDLVLVAAYNLPANADRSGGTGPVRE
jgi:hypothetical protein